MLRPKEGGTATDSKPLCRACKAAPATHFINLRSELTRAGGALNYVGHYCESCGVAELERQSAKGPEPTFFLRSQGGRMYRRRRAGQP